MKALILLAVLVMTVAIPVRVGGDRKEHGPQVAVTLFAAFVLVEALLLRFVYVRL